MTFKKVFRVMDGMSNAVLNFEHLAQQLATFDLATLLDNQQVKL